MSGVEEVNGLAFWRSSLLNGVNGVVHGVSTRRGGISRRPFASLNAGLHVGDLQEDVLCNRAILLKALGFGLNESVCAEQVHGAKVEEVTLDDVGKGAFRYETAVPGADGLITSARRVVLMGYFADCVPILIADRQGRWVGLGHAGWRGTLEGVASNLVEALRTRGVPVSDMYVALGPAIGVCCYEVSEDLAHRFVESFGPQVVKRSATGSPVLDLVAANVHALQREGLGIKQIQMAQECTACHTDRFFSHRKEGPTTGRMAAVVALS